jgi:mono/diheme cytochrome c family protein
VNRRCAAVMLLVFCAACRQDMQQQPKYVPLDRSWFFPDGRMARPIPAGTVTYDAANPEPAMDTGMLHGSFVTTIPLAVDTALLQRGHGRYDIYCSPCHGYTGDGNGMIARRGFKRPADLNDPRVRNAPPGYLFAVISNGYGAMSDYAYQIKDVRDRWAIVAYIRALELSRSAGVSDVPPEHMGDLER